jgi:CheY-like chemotaxis protein
MGGDIEVQSELGVGSTFTVRLPTRPSEQALTEAVRDAQLDTRSIPAYRRPPRTAEMAGRAAVPTPEAPPAPPTPPAPLTTAEFLPRPVDRDRLTALLRARRPGGGGRALVVDDDASARDLLCRALEREGWTVREADSGRAALARVREGAPDLVLLDLMMPQMDGVDFLATFRLVREWQEIPVVIVSAKSPEEADRLGVERYAARVAPPAAPARS